DPARLLRRARTRRRDRRLRRRGGHPGRGGAGACRGQHLVRRRGQGRRRPHRDRRAQQRTGRLRPALRPDLPGHRRRGRHDRSPRRRARLHRRGRVPRGDGGGAPQRCCPRQRLSPGRGLCAAGRHGRPAGLAGRRHPGQGEAPGHRAGARADPVGHGVVRLACPALPRQAARV
ncbi:MAG: Carbonic anhydrase, gamma class, partial [uncultured Nocardioidaceae bacterium]